MRLCMLYNSLVTENIQSLENVLKISDKKIKKNRLRERDIVKKNLMRYMNLKISLKILIHIHSQING